MRRLLRSGPGLAKMGRDASVANGMVVLIEFGKCIGWVTPKTNDIPTVKSMSNQCGASQITEAKWGQGNSHGGRAAERPGIGTVYQIEHMGGSAARAKSMQR